ncbi:hypothetical protein NQ314_016301 [Rhamnusium bicolor]|uniref:Peptidase M14 domain-containing protein n=1 Tax=Rhamnusium bicolor TaxID=1586634 RepID=A0AAV8WZ31_9CUCU|nr:hypothetical protein NQ314_016301 [Rhamnusium bicolor]
MDRYCDPLQHTSIYQRREDSDDSDGEGGMGNVNRIIMRPPGHSGKAKRGHLCFDASFETGNLGRVDLVSEYEYDLFIRPDTCNPKVRFWFNFTVDNVKQDQRVIFNIVNISKERNLFMEHMTPLVKSSSRPKWYSMSIFSFSIFSSAFSDFRQRIPKAFVFYQKSAVHQGHYVLSFSFGFDKEDDVFQFCLAPPYSYTRLQTFLNTLEKKATYLSENFKRELLESSVQKRRLDLITIGSLDRNQPKSKRRVVAIMARVHPGESPASFVCQGLLELLISSNSIATVLREHVIFKIIPMLNPDGVFLGNYRSTVMGTDLNRSWHIANPWCHPTIKAAIDMLLVLDKNKVDFLNVRYNFLSVFKDMRCGRNLVRTFLEYYHNIGAIPIQIATEIGNKKPRPRTNQIRRRNKNRYQKRPLTGRTQALLHFKNLNINYDSETSIEDYTYSYRNSSPQRTFEKISEQLNLRKTAVGGGDNVQKLCRNGSPPPTTYVVLPEPSLSIIDFNVISRGDIEKVSNLNKVKLKKK